MTTPEKMYRGEFLVKYLFAGDLNAHAKTIQPAIEENCGVIRQWFGPMNNILSVQRSASLIELEGPPLSHGDINIYFQLGADRAATGILLDDILMLSVNDYLIRNLTSSKCTILSRKYNSFATDFANRASDEEKQRVIKDMSRMIEKNQPPQ